MARERGRNEEEEEEEKVVVVVAMVVGVVAAVGAPSALVAATVLMVSAWGEWSAPRKEEDKEFEETYGDARGVSLPAALICVPEAESSASGAVVALLLSFDAEGLLPSPRLLLDSYRTAERGCCWVDIELGESSLALSAPTSLSPLPMECGL